VRRHARNFRGRGTRFSSRRAAGLVTAPLIGTPGGLSAVNRDSPGRRIARLSR
jgi:hypothetical protein